MKKVLKSSPKVVASAERKPNKISFTSADMALHDLLLDPNNYRFLDNPSYKKKIKNRFHDQSVQNSTLRLLEQDKRYQLSELKKSILTNGYVPMERIIVVPYQYDGKGKHLVVEGNRRVAALKSLIQEAKEGVRELSAEELKSLSKIPCAILNAPSASLKHAERVIMGIRHIAGPKEWGAYQQAQLITELRDEEGEDFTSIGEHLGISAVEVSRRYRAMRALQGMEHDELYAASASTEFYRLFHELVSLPEVRKRFGWDDDRSSFIDSEKAREFFELIAPQDSEEPKLRTYSDVRRLKLIVHRSKAEAALLDPDRTLADALRLADAEIAEESSDTMTIGDTAVEMRSRIQRFKMSDLDGIDDADLKRIGQLKAAVEKLLQMAKRQLGQEPNADSASD